VTAEFDEWKKHRKIAAPAFSEVCRCLLVLVWCITTDGSQKNKRLAFEEAVRGIVTLYEGEWRGKEEIAVERTLDLTMAVSSNSPLPTWRILLSSPRWVS
jgi:hypothetical protein